MTDKHEALIFADDRRTSSGDDLYEWAIDAEDWIRRQHARIAELEAQLESIAASAGSEPVAWRVRRHDAPNYWIIFLHRPVDAMADPGREVQPLYTHPSPPEGMVGWWVSVDERLPEPGVPVLLDIDKEYPIRAMWAAKFTLPVGLEDDSGFGEHDGLTDEWYCPEGWYEWNEHEDVHWRVDKTPRAWAPLPPTTSAGSGKGE